MRLEEVCGEVREMTAGGVAVVVGAGAGEGVDELNRLVNGHTNHEDDAACVLGSRDTTGGVLGPWDAWDT